MAGRLSAGSVEGNRVNIKHPSLLGLCPCLAAMPAASAANIDDITIQQNGGTWSTDGAWSIAGITDVGSSANAFLNTAPGYTSISIPSGTYLIFLGYEA